MTKMKLVMSGLALVASLATASAGDYLTNTNQHVSFLRNPARNASTEIDAVYSNPAGIAFLAKNGWHFSINSQTATQTRNINSTFPLFAGNLDGQSSAIGERQFKGKAFAPVIPSLFAVYKGHRWAFGAHFALVGGGGKANFESGLPSFESQVAGLPTRLSAAGIPAQGYRYDTAMKGHQYIFGLSLGASYRITDRLSAYLGVRTNYVNNHYEGYLRNLQSNINGNLVNVSQALSAMAQQVQASNPNLAAALTRYATLTGDKELNVDQNGWGITPIIGLNYRLGRLHLAAKYEFKTSLDIKNETTVNTTGVSAYNDGINTPHDIPAMLSVGASYSIIDELRVSAGYHHYYDRKAGMANNRQTTLKHGTHEYLLGVEGDLSRRLTLSAGLQITDYGLSDSFQQDLSFSCDSFSVGTGFAYKLSDKVRLNAAYFLTTYRDYTKQSANYLGTATAVPGKDVYSRTNHVFGVGVDFIL